MSKHEIKELWIDPQSNQLGASRFCLLVLVFDMQYMIIAESCGIHFAFWSQFALILGSVAGIYAVNTGIRVWKGKVYEHDHKEG